MTNFHNMKKHEYLLFIFQLEIRIKQNEHFRLLIDKKEHSDKEMVIPLLGIKEKKQQKIDIVGDSKCARHKV